MGTSRHRTWAVVTLTEGICNVILSVILIRPYGIVGDALGTAIPMTFSMVLFMPRHLCRQLGVRLGTYLREAFVLPLLITIPFAAVLWLMKFWFIPHNYRQLGVQFLIGGSVYGMGMLWAYRSKRLLRVDEASIKEPQAASTVLMPVQVQGLQEDI
jgi:O-antigen/teichoic acid export membrane protein